VLDDGAIDEGRSLPTSASSRRKIIMSFQLFKGIVAGGFFLLAGCGGTAEVPGDFETAPDVKPQGGSTAGTLGYNGLSPVAYHANITALLSAFGVAAVDPGNASAVNPAIEATGLLATSGGREVFEYAVRCALPTESEIESGTRVYSGGGILTTTAPWVTGGLTTEQKEEALTCMIAHLNPLGATVPIFLSGPSVAGSELSDAGGFGIEEAIWQVKIPGPGQAPIYNAWPRANLLNVCGLLTTVSWISRICGSPLNTCGVQVRYDSSTVCTGSDGSFSCNGRPTVQTSLEKSALCLL
jgi:hypothetical protein